MDDRRRRTTRSRSPTRDERKRARHSSRDDEADPHRRTRETSKSLPFHARQLTKHDLDVYRPMFALYLDIQKRHDIEVLSEDEVKGRWKSFVNKWNRGDLAEGWYDPATLTEAQDSNRSLPRTKHQPRDEGDEYAAQKQEQANAATQDEEEADLDDDYGPALPTSQHMQLMSHDDLGAYKTEAGPTIPTHQDLRVRDEDSRLAADTAHQAQLETLKHQRQHDRTVQKSRLEELAPRAEPGTRERQLEKKRELADSNRAFAASKEGGGDVEIRDGDLMGGDDLGELKRMKKEQERRKSEREVKREELLRARMAERGQKLKAMRDKEEKTMSMLREIAKERFGGGNEHSATLREESA